ncbi:MAG TPA: hypothetical protein EYN91_10775 [Candidatus Melainabacteria bacterium]|jgi:hypothetical protein|nr:hypothetical protein [Candidatus Obscuribacterales bacterium]HIA52557.1 hypothetical protein [Candidatus Melainabacteria bacterium]HIN64094.1 hypothetical protein [Candidatus Obscuribacterales bacterium]
MYHPTIFVRASFVAVFVLAASSASAAPEPKSIFSGYLVDKQCANSVREDSDPVDFIKHHTKDCSLMINCRSCATSFDLRKETKITSEKP